MNERLSGFYDWIEGHLKMIHATAVQLLLHSSIFRVSCYNLVVKKKKKLMLKVADSPPARLVICLNVQRSTSKMKNLQRPIQVNIDIV